MKKAIIIILCITMFAVCLSGCGFSEDVGNETPCESTLESDEETRETLPPEASSAPTVLEKIKANMTFSEVVLILGDNWKDYSAVAHPFSATWELEDGGELTIKFKSEAYEEFVKKKAEGQETGALTLEKVSEWRRESKAVSATIWKNKENKVLFNEN